MKSVTINNKQRYVLILSAISMVIAVLLPPWTYKHDGYEMHAGFSFLMMPPESWCVVNLGLLMIELFVIALVGSILFVCTKGQATTQD